MIASISILIEKRAVEVVHFVWKHWTGRVKLSEAAILTESFFSGVRWDRGIAHLFHLPEVVESIVDWADSLLYSLGILFSVICSDFDTRSICTLDRLHKWVFLFSRLQ